MSTRRVVVTGGAPAVQYTTSAAGDRCDSPAADTSARTTALPT